MKYWDLSCTGELLRLSTCGWRIWNKGMNRHRSLREDPQGHQLLISNMIEICGTRFSISQDSFMLLKEVETVVGTLARFKSRLWFCIFLSLFLWLGIPRGEMQGHSPKQIWRMLRLWTEKLFNFVSCDRIFLAWCSTCMHVHLSHDTRWGFIGVVNRSKGEGYLQDQRDAEAPQGSKQIK